MKERLKNLYQNKGLAPQRLLSAVAKGWLTVADVVEIVGEDNATEVILNAKVAEISAACNAAIEAGVDIELNGETEHFNLDIKDQSNIANLFRVVELGGTEFPYQADDGSCKVYSATEIAAIYIAAQTLITTQTAYHNALKAYINALTESEEIAAIQYGMDLPEPFASELASKLAVAQAQMEAILNRLGGNA